MASQKVPNLNRFPASKTSEKFDANSSDSFTNSQGFKLRTPERLKVKPAGNKSEFTSSVQEFLKQSTEIQDEIRKLSEICQQISPKFVNSKQLNIPEQIDWEKINELLKDCGFSELIMENDRVSYESLSETFVEVVYEFSSQSGILEQNKEALKRLEIELDQVVEENQRLKKKVGKVRDRESFESEIRELERMSKGMESKFRRMKEKIKEKDEAIRELKCGKIGVVESEGRLDKVFEAFMGRKIREGSKTDLKVVGIIEMFENKKADSQLQVILDELEVFSGNEALQCIAKLKQDSFIAIETERVVQELYYLLFSRPLAVSFKVKHEDVYQDIMQKVNELKNELNYFGEFKDNVVSAVSCKKNSEMSEIIERLQVISHFRKLFAMNEAEDEIKMVERLYDFVHEMKVFLHGAKGIIGKSDMQIGELLAEINRRLVRNSNRTD